MSLLADPTDYRAACAFRDQHIRELLDAVDEFNEIRPKDQCGPKEYQARFLNAIDREKASSIIRAVLSLYECRAGSVASGYAVEHLKETLR